MHDSLYQTYIFHNDHLIKFSQYEKDIDRSFVELTFRNISKYIDLTDALIFTFPRALSIVNIDPVIDYIKSSGVKKVYFFIEDVLTVECPYESDHLDLTVIDRYPTEFLIREFEIIRKIISNTLVDNTVFHCEHNLKEIKDRYPDLNLKYFDIFVSTTLRAVFDTIDHVDRSLDIEYKICCFNHRAEPYRTIIASLLYNESNVLLTLGKAVSLYELRRNRSLPFIDFNDSIKEQVIQNLPMIMKNGGSITWDVPSTSVYAILSMKDQWNTVNVIGKSFCTLVTETRYATDLINFSEKSIKPILMKRPFLLLAPPHTLQFLKTLGFKTFDRWWDESYDEIDDHHKRLEVVYKITKTILKKSDTELSTILGEMSEIVEHNFNTLKTINHSMFTLLD